MPGFERSSRRNKVIMSIFIIACACLCATFIQLNVDENERSLHEQQIRVVDQELNDSVQIMDENFLGIERVVMALSKQIDITQINSKMDLWKSLLPDATEIHFYTQTDEREKEVVAAISQGGKPVWFFDQNQLTFSKLITGSNQSVVAVIDFNSRMIDLLTNRKNESIHLAQTNDEMIKLLDVTKEYRNKQSTITGWYFVKEIVPTGPSKLAVINMNPTSAYVWMFILIVLPMMLIYLWRFENGTSSQLRNDVLGVTKRAMEQEGIDQSAQENMVAENQPIEPETILDASKSHDTEIPLEQPISIIGDEVEEINIPHGKGEMIFIVDDDHVALRVASRQLQLHGYRTQTFDTSAGFLSGVEQFGVPDAILLDVMLPDVSGLDLCKVLRDRYTPIELPIIFLSGRGELPDMIHGFDQGGNDYLIKPVTKEELLVRLRIQIQLSMWGNEMKEAVIRRSGSMRALMDHSDQGFMSIGQDLIISEEYSLACKRMFNRELTGLPFAALLEPNNPIEEELLTQILIKLFVETNPISREIMLGLLPVSMLVDQRVLSLTYKILEDETGMPIRVLVFINDQTDAERLRKRITEEQYQLKMVVKVVTKRRDFTDLLEHYFSFCDSWADEMVSDTQTPMFILMDLYRQFHTFKGNFSQYDMHHSVKQFHEFEHILNEMTRQQFTHDDLRHLMSKYSFRLFIQSDLDVIIRALGEEFMKKTDDVTIQRHRMKELEQMAMQELTGEQSHEFTVALRCLYYKPLKSLLEPYSPYVQQLAQRMDKSVHAFKVDGDGTLVDEFAFEGFLNAMVHIFRNSVDHGIETYEDRIEFGKDGNAKITCKVSEQRDGILIEVRDDGRGISPSRVKRRALDLGLLSERDSNLWNDAQIINLIFHEQFTTKKVVTEISGRGIGLSAIKQVVAQMGGRIHVNSSTGDGTTVAIKLPWGDGIVPQNALYMKFTKT